MFQNRSAASSAGLFVVALLAMQDSLAIPTSHIGAYGYARTQATTDPQNPSTYVYNAFGSDRNGVYQPAGFAGNTDAVSRGTVSFGPNYPTYPTAADATAAGSASYGALHGVAGVDTTVGGLLVYNTTAAAQVGFYWFDALIFHTSNPLGIDYHFSLTLNDALSTSVAPSATGFLTGPASTIVAEAFASTSLAVLPQTSAGAAENQTFEVVDHFIQYGSPDERTPGATSQTIAPSHTLSGTIHVFDGEEVDFMQNFAVAANTYNGNATAGANAADTAFFNLFTFDPQGSYTSDSGTVYATSGDPDSGPVVTAPPTGTVPEPSGVALMLAGFGAFVFERRRIDRSKR